MRKLSETVRNLRKVNNLLLKDLAGKIECNVAALSDWEHGRSYPTEETCHKMEKIFDIPQGFLWGIVQDEITFSGAGGDILLLRVSPYKSTSEYEKIIPLKGSSFISILCSTTDWEHIHPPMEIMLEGRFISELHRIQVHISANEPHVQYKILLETACGEETLDEALLPLGYRKVY